MFTSTKNKAAILSKLGIEHLNPMQEEAQLAITSANQVILLSPTGTGKTLAFLLPIIKSLDENCDEIQATVIVPSRELAIQIEQVLREMGTGFKVNAIYGGRSRSKDKEEIKHRPAILIGTPGRVADHLRRGTFDTEYIQTLVLDEFDKSLEVGFENEMREILKFLSNIEKKILTSATQGLQIPEFVNSQKSIMIDYLEKKTNLLQIKKVIVPKKDKLSTLIDLIAHIGDQNGIIFCNFKDAIQRISDHLEDHGIFHGMFHGGMEQKDRERSLIKFRNSTHKILVSTDLAARGIDVPELDFIIHFHLPLKEEEFTHRNGRTARMNSQGTAYVLQYKNEISPFFIENIPLEKLINFNTYILPEWSTLFISGGRQDKISKGDIVGLFFKRGNLTKEDVGVIELKKDCAFIAVKTFLVNDLLPMVNNTKLKKKKIRISII